MDIMVFHCSPYLIDKFNFDNGIHFGSKKSAIKAGKRKLYNLKTYKGYKQNTLYMYTFILNTSNKVFNNHETDDMGNDWVEYKNTIMKRDNLSFISYRNKYEPDYYPSYYIINPDCIKLINTEII